MAKYRIALMPGDGIGKEVMEAAHIVLDRISLDATLVPADIGWEYWCTEGDALPQRTIDTLKTCDCALFASITSKPTQEAQLELAPALQGTNLVYRSPIVRLRQLFDLYVNMRPCKALKGNPLNYRDDIDLVIFRENTQGLYAGVEFHPLPTAVRTALESHNPRMKAFAHVSQEDIAISCRIFTRAGCRRILRRAFEHAENFNYSTVTLIEKPNVIRETSGMMVYEARKIAAQFPRIELWETNVDAMAMWLLKRPQDYGVLVSSNLFGDIVSDLASQLVGGLGFAASGNIGQHFAVFEPTHGSAPKHAGFYRANPIAMRSALRLMLTWLGEAEIAHALQQAIATVIAEGNVRTYDIGGNHTTLEMAHAVASSL